MLINTSHFVVSHGRESREDAAQLDLMERIEFHEQSMFDVVMQSSNREVGNVIQLTNVLRILIAS